MGGGGAAATGSPNIALKAFKSPKLEMAIHPKPRGILTVSDEKLSELASRYAPAHIHANTRDRFFISH